MNWYYWWQKLAFQIVHKTTIWVPLTFLATSLTAWFLAGILEKHNAREREALLARRTAIVYTATAFALWLFSFIFK
ncbi:Hypothetical protein LUCI_1629 [Lucifera butyrica]|uniref:Uncharacterized protein n=1 Tax=Lucifera butyrica TaxID=1351585 RepID=A0A498RB94_9FIRM|nr:hypothetical protein [Lucifera butyrica]VBB06398.1 Hypothetical protein LUCI_1629 [Lucifera butyrica]